MAITASAEPAGAVARLSLAMWCWMGATALICLLAWRFGAKVETAAAAAALALAPAVVTFLVLGRWGENWARTLAIFSWIAFATVACVLTGAMASPAVAAFLIAPGIAAHTGERERVVEATLFSAFGAFAASSMAAAAQARGAVGPEGLDLLPSLRGALAVVFVGGLMAQVLELTPRSLVAKPGPTGVTPVRGRAMLAQGTASMVLNSQGEALAYTPACAAVLGVVGRLRPNGKLSEALAGTVDGETRANLQQAIEAATKGADARLAMIARAIDGPVRTVELTLRPAGAGLAGLTAVDITALGTRVAEAQAALTAAAGASEAKSRHVGELSHELRTPLTHIIGFAELMEREVFGPMPEKYGEYAGLIRASGSHLLSLVNDMVDLSRIEEGRHALELADFNVCDVAGEVVALSQGSAQNKNISLTLQAPGGPLAVRADVRAVRQMLINTVGNAVKFTPEGGQVRLALRAEGVNLLIDTIDTGPGISDQDKAILGERFVRGAHANGAAGSGLGLSLVKALAELHQGQLSFHDAPEGGALVRITLPVVVS